MYGDEIVKVYCNTALESTVTSLNASSVLFLVHIQTPAILGTIYSSVTAWTNPTSFQSTSCYPYLWELSSARIVTFIYR
jgi:hypothetical protein